MMGRNLTLIEILGIKIKVNISWVFIAVFLAWALAQGYFPTVYEGLSGATYWWMGIVGVLGLFLSILLHELSHSLVARAFGMEITGITLWLLGGVAELKDEPPSPKVEFLMAIAGPAMSVALGGVLLLVAGMIEGVTPIGAVVRYLGTLNLILAAFNLVPAFPLDGGRVARAAIWMQTGDYARATDIAARMGSMFGLALILIGLLSAVSGAGFGGLWWVVLGIFIRFAADASRYQVQTKEALKGRRVRDLMTRAPVTISPDIVIADLIENWIYHHDFEFFPVVENGKLVGSVSLQEVRNVPADRRNVLRTGDVMRGFSPDQTIAPDAFASDVLKKMQAGGDSLLMVVDGSELVGVVALKDLLRFVAINATLQQASEG